MAGNSQIISSYRPIYSAARLLENWEHYLGEIAYQTKTIPIAAVPVFWIGLVLLAAAFRGRLLPFCLAFLLISALPVCFIDPRGLNVFYIPLAGLTIYASAIITGSRISEYCEPKSPISGVSSKRRNSPPC